ADTYTDQNCAPTPPAAIRGQSVWIVATGWSRSVVSRSTSSATRRVHGRSLWPSRIGWRVSRSRAAVAAAGLASVLVIAPAYVDRPDGSSVALACEQPARGGGATALRPDSPRP